MCGRYVSTQSIEVIERHFNIRVPSNIVLEPSYKIPPENYVPLISDAKPKELQLLQLGLIPELKIVIMKTKKVVFVNLNMMNRTN